MFGSKHYHTHNVHRTATVNTTVHEHRAPTDESIRLAEEMREKAIQRIVDTFTVKVSTIEGATLVSYMVPQNNAMEFRVKFNLNGKEHTVRGELYRADVDATAPSHYYDPVREAMARAIAEKITEHLLNQNQ